MRFTSARRAKGGGRLASAVTILKSQLPRFSEFRQYQDRAHEFLQQAHE
jgi:hypothetical protein